MRNIKEVQRKPGEKQGLWIGMRCGAPRKKTLPAALALPVLAVFLTLHPEVQAAQATNIQEVQEAHATQGRLEFPASMLFFPVDVELFAEGNPVLPGVHRLDVLLNDVWKGKYDIRFERIQPEDHNAQACFDQNLLSTLGLDPAYIDDGFIERLQAGEAVCSGLGQLIAGAAAEYDSLALRLNLSIPQAALRRQTRGAVDPSRWDAGITAATLAWDYNGWRSQQAGTIQISHYLGLRGGVNVGDWRVRYRATANKNRGARWQYRGDAVSLERALPGWRSRLTLGDTTTDSRIIDGIRFRGVALASDARMHPDAANSFAPVIRGIAQSNAKVTVHQRGVQVFEMTVPPGPFVIDDLLPNGNGGDLQVTITETDGSVHGFTVTWASLPELLRPGVTHYSAALGQTRNVGENHGFRFAAATLARGVNNTVTAYGGALVTQEFRTATLGAALNLPVGAVTLDARASRMALPGVRLGGAALRLTYARFLAASDTDFTLTWTRTLNPAYLEPAQAFDLLTRLRSDRRLGGDIVTAQATAAARTQRRNQFSVNVGQTLPGKWGYLSFSGSVQSVWSRRAREVQYYAGYGRGFGALSASVTAARSRNLTTGRWENQVLLNFSLPLGSMLPARGQAYLNSSVAHRPGGQTAQASVSATLGDTDPYHYNLYTTLDRGRQRALHASGGASLGWTTRAARMAASVSAGAGGAQQTSLSASGGVVAFSDGVVFVPELGETVGIVQAKGAVGARMLAATGARLDARGHAIAAHLQPYRENIVELDARGTSTDVELLNATQTVAPTEGAVVLLRFETHTGYSALLTGRRHDGSPLPFAAGVFDADGKNVGYLSQGGQALLRVEHMQGALQVRWGAQADEQCRFSYDLDNDAGSRGRIDRRDRTDTVGALRRIDAVCL